MWKLPGTMLFLCTSHTRNGLGQATISHASLAPIKMGEIFFSENLSVTNFNLGGITRKINSTIQESLKNLFWNTGSVTCCAAFVMHYSVCWDCLFGRSAWKEQSGVKHVLVLSHTTLFVWQQHLPVVLYRFYGHNCHWRGKPNAGKCVRYHRGLCLCVQLKNLDSWKISEAVIKKSLWEQFGLPFFEEWGGSGRGTRHNFGKVALVKHTGDLGFLRSMVLFYSCSKCIKHWKESRKHRNTIYVSPRPLVRFWHDQPTQTQFLFSTFGHKNVFKNS